MSRTNFKLLSSTFRGGKMYNGDRRGLPCRHHEDEVLPFEHGPAITRSVRSMRDEGATGHIEFDQFGLRRAFKLDVHDVSSSIKDNVMAISTSSVSSWEEGLGFVDDARVTSQRRFNKTALVKRVRVVTTILSQPFVMLKKSGKGERFEGNERFEGFCVDLIQLISKQIPGFDYVIRLVNDSKYGSLVSNGTWNGMIGELLRHEADLAVASLTITRARERVVDFTKPFITLGLSIMISKPAKQEFSVFSFMSPLSTEIWLYIIFAYLGVSVVIFLVSRFSPYEWRVEDTNNGISISNDFNVYNCLWFTLAAFMQQGTDILPRSFSGRIASSAWWFFTMILVSSYTANLAAFLTLEKMQTPIESVEHLAKQTKIKYGIQGSGSSADFFRESTVDTYKRMWQFMSSQSPSVFTKDYAEGINRVRESRGRYAFLLESTANDYTNSRMPCDTMKVGQNLNSVGYGIATAFGSDLRDPLNLAILELQEKGHLKKLQNKWWFDLGECEAASQDHSSSLNTSKVAGIFYILVVGMAISLLAALGEFIYRSYQEAKRLNEPLVFTMKHHFDIFINGERHLAT